ncbi:extracellular solute-binding protein [Paenibacillus nanensis]|uniref:Extracellular solute-binding protein n=1 Tax=Paenibacillus nanensis TaxID=393251 RepID=A0A3A1VG24_9BACL|nr:extracellular solute-binding protein [Paenibacillus nanensis]RIX59301.1 extracellular solute-binding protein [Paenibacillus nanensis]
MNSNGIKKSRLWKWTALGMSLTLLLGLLSACSGSNSPNEAENSVIRIGVLYGSPDNDAYFRQQYTDMYEMQNPNVEFELVYGINYYDSQFDQPKPGEESKQPDPYEKMKELLTGQNPVDVVVVDYNMLRRLNQDNLLQPLDPMIQKDKFDISDYVPTVIDGIKSVGDSSIYALTPTFTSYALYYNKKIFADKSVEPPTDKMTWDDVFNKARQVAGGEGEEKVFGFAFNRWVNDPFSDAQNYSNSLQLRIWDENGEKMVVNSEPWTQVWETVSQLHKDDILPDQEFMNQLYEKRSGESEPVNNPFFGDLFISGNLAMVLGESSYVNELKRASDNASKIEGFEMVDWDIVTVPVNPQTPDAGGNISLSQLMGINAKAQNAEGAWDFIKFSNSKEWAKLKSRSSYELVARKEFLQPVGGMQYNIDAFTMLKPLPPTTNNDDRIYQEKPNVWEAQNIGYELFQGVMDGSKDVKEALAEWETRGNAILQGQSEAGGDVGIPVEPLPMPRSDAATTDEAVVETEAVEVVE